jgi:cytochrome d ubiquinol oxidase subunit II
MFDYETLRLIWWLLLGVLLAGFAVTDGYDLGVGAILRFIARDDVERRMTIEAIEPHWEGHQVWFVLGGGAVFAAWPLLYAAAFSGLLLRDAAGAARVDPATGRVRVPQQADRAAMARHVGLGAHRGRRGAVARVRRRVRQPVPRRAVPFHRSLRAVYDGSFIALFHPFALLCGVVSLAMLVTHGATFAAMKIEDPVGARAQRIARIAAIVTIVAFVGCGLWLLALPGHVLARRSMATGRRIRCTSRSPWSPADG